MPKILITGANGQLGSEFKALAPSHPAWHFTFTDVGELDITDLKAVKQYISGGRFDVLVNCAGYTAVDKAEEEPEKALLLNSTAVGNLVFACMNSDCFPIHISTDYVFSGKHSLPYTEKELPDPDSVYGVSKLLGEEIFLDLAPKGIIIRTSWLYSAYGSNFVKTVLSVCWEKGELRVVDDQLGCPTWANDLARHILEILPAAMKLEKPEIFHYSNDGQCSWYELAVEAVKLAGMDCKVMPIKTADFPTLATRPAFSILDKTKIMQTFGLSLPHWKYSLKYCIKELK